MDFKMLYDFIYINGLLFLTNMQHVNVVAGRGGAYLKLLYTLLVSLIYNKALL